METEFIYWAHPTPVGIRVEEISGAENKAGKLWLEMARQIYCENGREDFREIGHFKNGAPFLFGFPSRISITHATHLLAVASLPKTPETNLAEFSPRTALGIDAERLDREQVMRVRERVLNPAELEMTGNDLEKNIIAWTVKEAVYKAALTEGLDFRENIRIVSLPEIDREMNRPGAPTPVLGRASAKVETADGSSVFDFNLYSYESEGHCVTLAFSPKCAKFSR